LGNTLSDVVAEEVVEDEGGGGNELYPVTGCRAAGRLISNFSCVCVYYFTSCCCCSPARQMGSMAGVSPTFSHMVAITVLRSAWLTAIFCLHYYILALVNLQAAVNELCLPTYKKTAHNKRFRFCMNLKPQFALLLICTKH
jgi:hypothetical protein